MANDNSDLIRLTLEKLVKLERNVSATKAFVNVLCLEDGKPPMFPDDGGSSSVTMGGGGGGGSAPVSVKIKSDTFFGKRQQSAVREYLEMRKAAGDGPASPRVIFEALKEGGFQFEAKDDTTSLIGLRALLRKRTAFFVKTGSTGAYGLREWYPNLKKPKPSTTEADDDAESDDDEVDEQEDDPANEPKHGFARRRRAVS